MSHAGIKSTIHSAEVDRSASTLTVGYKTCAKYYICLVDLMFISVTVKRGVLGSIAKSSISDQ